MAGVISRYWATTGITTLLPSAPNPVSITADIGKANWCGEMIIIGFDSEWVYLPEENRNHILSYQFTVLTTSSGCSGIVYTEGPELKHRWKLSDLLGHAIQVAREQGVLGRSWPQEVCAAAHSSPFDAAFSIWSRSWTGRRAAYWPGVCRTPCTPASGLPPEKWSTHWVRFDPFLRRIERWQASEKRQKISS